MQVERIDLAAELRRIAGEMLRANRGWPYSESKYDADLLRDAARELDARRTPGPATRAMLGLAQQIADSEVTTRPATDIALAFLAEWSEPGEHQ